MIVGPCFHDDHGALSWQQQDRYHDALNVIVQGCQNHLYTARYMLSVNDEVELPVSFDHRVLQHAHDILAAVWRYRLDDAQLGLFEKAMADMKGWLAWLECEVERWWREPQLVRFVRNSLRYENSKNGRIAEALVVERLIRLYADVPWTEALREAARADYNAAMKGEPNPDVNQPA